MSRVERIETPTDRRANERLHRTERARTNRRTDSPGRTPGKAEGEERDIEEALEHLPE